MRAEGRAQVAVQARGEPVPGTAGHLGAEGPFGGAAGAAPRPRRGRRAPGQRAPRLGSDSQAQVENEARKLHSPPKSIRVFRLSCSRETGGVMDRRRAEQSSLRRGSANRCRRLLRGTMRDCSLLNIDMLSVYIC